MTARLQYTRADRLAGRKLPPGAKLVDQLIANNDPADTENTRETPAETWHSLTKTWHPRTA